MISRTFKLCLNAGSGSAPYINVNQYDEGETWLFELYSENGERYIPSSGAIVGVKSDGHGIVNTGTVDSEGRVVITETQQMTASAGRAIYELSIDGLTHGTANFIVAVERKPTDDAVMSDSDLSLIQEAIDSAEVIVEVIGDGDPSEVIGEHVDAWLDNHPEATTTVEDGAITAPKINQSLWDKLLVSESASGNPASFEDGADDVPVSSLKVNLEPIQLGSGDPSPTNIRPISGHSSVTVERTGKNLFDNTANVDKWLDQSGSIVSGYVGSYVSGRLLSKEGLTYTIAAANVQAGAFAICFYDGNGQLLQRSAEATVNKLTATAPAGTAYLYAGIYIAPNLNIQLEYGTEPTAYVPFVECTSYPYTLGQNVYGGSVNVATGVLTVTHKLVTFDGTETWGSPSTGYYTLQKGSDLDATEQYSNTMVCNYLPYIYTQPSTTPSFNAITHSIRVSLPSVTSLANFRAYLASNPLTIVLKLATPQTIQLTPTQVKTLLGYNNISSSGTVDVIYHADTKLYVDKMTEVDNNIIAPTEETFTATRNYTVNDLLIVADTLYKCTANIASGSAITPNSNVQQTTLGALIKALS